MPSANRECSICHIMWLNEFKRDDITTLVPYDPKPVVETGKQDVSSTKRMCFTCHDGFINDSRFMWKRDTHMHPVGKKPSNDINIPIIEGKQIFPLNEDGKVYCGTCHSAHGVDWAQDKSAVFMRMKNVNSSMCVACHKAKTRGPKSGNHPINVDLAEQPTQLFRAGSRFGTDGRVVCESCHMPHGAAAEKILVMSNKESNLCRSCHDDKKSINQTKHNMALTVPDAVNINGKTASETGPCSVCHIPHNAKGAALWAREPFESKDPAAAPCIVCHNDKGLAKKKTINDHSHPTQVAIEELGITVKNQQWQSKYVEKSGKKQKTLPLYNASGQRVKHGGNVSCGTCHDPHVWSAIPYIPPETSQITKQEGDGQNSFLRIAQGKNSNLCMNCHVDKKSLFLSKHNRDLGKKKKDQDSNVKDVGDIKDSKYANYEMDDIDDIDVKNGNDGNDGNDGVCSECHFAHNGKGPYMQAKAGGEGKGAIEKICTVCHKQDGAAGKKLTGQHSHPVGMSLDKLGVKTKLPLFTKDGKRHPQGNVDCATCHNVHQWDPANRFSRSGAKVKVEGDFTNSFLRIRNTEKSNLCTDCHTKKKTIFKTEHDLNLTAPKSKNIDGQNLQRSGVCGACHSVHNAKTTVALWARKPFAAKNIKDALCLGCHNVSGLAKEKVPPVYTHPEHVLAWSDRLRQFIGSKILPDIPVFSDQGYSEPMGKIVCASCHDPHRWSARHDSSPGKNTEGSVLNSFLRNSSSENIVCADCHGRGALFRYKYFHSKKSRRMYPLSE